MHPYLLRLVSCSEEREQNPKRPMSLSPNGRKRERVKTETNEQKADWNSLFCEYLGTRFVVNYSDISALRRLRRDKQLVMALI